MRRVWSSLYELMLLFGMAFVTSMVVNTILTLTHTRLPEMVFSLLNGLVMGGYFTYCWTHGGQTLAQRTWQLKSIRADGAPIGWARAWLRYGVSYLGVLPALLSVWTQIHGVHPTSATRTYTLALGGMLVNWLALLGTALASPDKMALHERLSKTRTVFQPNSN